MSIALLSNNVVLPKLENGWNGEILLIQDIGEMGNNVEHALFDTLSINLTRISEVVTLVSECGTRHILEMEQRHGVVASKAVFYICPCRLGKNRRMIRGAGFRTSPRYSCECGFEREIKAIHQYYR